jgi:hypothetical protein
MLHVSWDQLHAQQEAFTDVQFILAVQSDLPPTVDRRIQRSAMQCLHSPYTRLASVYAYQPVLQSANSGCFVERGRSALYSARENSIWVITE